MPRFNAEQLAKAESLGRELLASVSFDDDAAWQTYQESVAARLGKPLPARGDSQRRPAWGGITKAHKNMIKQLDVSADGHVHLLVAPSERRFPPCASNPR